ncbi:5-pentadecatrienyl resorcinol O-methyltransferase isoform X3 [Lolium perenne]|uniref:5-pentadecatrienyl resorcinol O-methyltransferase isoform X3 n=1 Tax=Lolium perenne TaxID=4522 RepID=UPI0021F5B8F6|nr:5-pentadecatrienyl resorcinol O-methyltransferase-like isoform X4 [Lolium perenne]
MRRSVGTGRRRAAEARSRRATTPPGGVTVAPAGPCVVDVAEEPPLLRPGLWEIRAIAKAFPHMKCTVSDLPHVVAEAPTDGNVSFISGDMFKYIPPANALFLKWIFHDWGDEDSVKILKKCKEAIPPRDAGGKVIIVDMVVGSGPNEIVTRETQVLYDLFIMCIEGIEREESKWKKIFMEAGFSDYKIMSVLGVRSVIELYP